MIFCIGIPLDENSSYLRGAALAPDKVREAFHCDSTNYWTESGINLQNHVAWKDLGNLDLPAMPGAFQVIEEAVNSHLLGRNKVLSLGGDHSITYPIIKAFARNYKQLTILHIDAHGDLYDDFQGNTFSHASPFARIMEQKLATELIQVGIRTYNGHQRDQLKRFDVKTVEMKDWRDDIKFTIEGPLYISLDLDALDPAFVPGVSHHEPGGFTTRQLLNMIQFVQAEIVGADIVELNPTRDLHGVTAMVAAKCFKEILAKMIV